VVQLALAYLHVVEEATKADFTNPILFLSQESKSLDMRGSY
jgi:hypothetical protein